MVKNALKQTRSIYLDYASTTPLDRGVLRAMLPYLKESFGNPSSIHGFGQKALLAVNESREKIAKFLRADSEEIIFTGSATEANNLAIKGVLENSKFQNLNYRPHIITSQIEHKGILETCKDLEKKGIETTYIPNDKQGLVSISALKKAIKKNTVLVSIIYANNEIGVIQPIAEIAKVIRNFRNSKSEASNPSASQILPKAKLARAKQIPNLKFQIPIFHTDAVQAINYLNCNVQKLGVDLLTLSAHKIYGPKGIGALYIKKGIILKPQILGGGQEQGLRAGTENVAAIVGFGEAINKLQTKNYKLKIKKIKKLRDRLIEQILKDIPESKLNGSKIKRLPNNANFNFKGVEGESLLIFLDQQGIAVSTGSACASKSLEPSHILLALGLSKEQAHSSIRFSLGRFTTLKQINYVLKVLPKTVKKIREISGYL